MLAGGLRHYLERNNLKCSLYALDVQYRSASHTVPDPDVVVVDTPGRFDVKLKGVIERSDVVVIPVRPTPSDVEPFLRTVDMVSSITDVPIVVCVNGLNGFKMSTAFMNWLSAQDIGDETVCVPQSEAIVQALDEERSVYGHDRLGHATAALETLGDTVSDLAGISVTVGIW